jgi:hypothetical protein
MSDIFISYNNKDKDKAKLFATLLTQQGWSVFWDKNIPPGKTFDDYIGEQLDAAKCIIVLWSKNSVSSDWVKEEAQRGAARKVLVPIFIEQVSPPLGFGRIEAAELIAWDGNTDEVEFQNLLHAITMLIPESEHTQRPSPSVAMPEPKSTGEPFKEPAPSFGPAHTPPSSAKRKTLLLWLAGLAIPLVIALAWLTWMNIHLDELVPENSWGVVLGSDQSLKEAHAEIDRRTSNTGIPKAKTSVFFRNGYYASITVVDNQDEANKYLTIAKTFGQGAYLTRMGSWCRSPQSSDGFVTCQRDSTKQ